MPDLQTALKDALNEWEPTSTTASEKPMETKQLPQTFKPTNNVTRETFNFIKTHYGCTSSQVKDAMVVRGFNKNSVHSLITQLVNSKQVIRDKEGRLATLVPEYIPMKSYSKTKAKQIKKKEKVPEYVIHEPTPPKVEVKADTSEHLTAKYVIDNIRVGEAKKLHQELIRIFQE
jgi:alpha-L-arabinofuranosidase